MLVCAGHRADEPLVCRDDSFLIVWLFRCAYPIRIKIFPLPHGRRTDRFSELHEVSRAMNRNRKTDQRPEMGQEKGRYVQGNKSHMVSQAPKSYRCAHVSKRRTHNTCTVRARS